MKIIKILSIVAVLLFISFPYGVKYGLIAYLETEYEVSASIDDIQFNVFTGVFGLEGVHIYGSNESDLHLGKIQVQLNLPQLIEQKIVIDLFTLSTLKTQITQNDQFWNIGGLKLPISNSVKDTENDPTSLWQFGVEAVELRQVGVDLKLNQFEGPIKIEALSVNQLYSWQPDTPTLFDLKMRVNDSPVLLEGRGHPFLTSLDINAKIKMTDLEVAPLVAKIEDDLKYQNIKATLNMALVVSYKENAKSKQINVNGQFTIDDLFLNDAIQLISIKEEKVEWNGNVEIEIPTADTNFSFNSSSIIRLAPLVIISEEKNIVLFSLEKFVLNDLSMERKNIHIKSIELNKMRVLEDLGSSKIRVPLLVNHLILENSNLKDNHLSIGNVLFSGMTVNLDVDTNGELLQSSMIADNNVEVDEEDEIEVSGGSIEDEKISFNIARLEITDNSQINFVDRSTTPVFEISFNQFKFESDNLNSKKMDSWSNISVNSMVNDFGQVNMKGKLQPFSEKLNMKLEAKLKNISLVQFSSYSGKYADLFIKRGAIDLSLKVSIVDDVLDIKNNLTLSKLKLEPGKSELSKKWLIELPMPLDLTLDALRDKNDVITLNIPIEGVASDPDFHLQDIYNTAMMKAFKMAATYYITQAIQPLGLVITASKIVGKAMKPSFEPLVFKSGSKIITSKNKKHLDKIQNLLIQRPKLTITVCSVSVEKDWQVVTEKAKKTDITPTIEERKKILLKLASDRSRSVRRFLVGDKILSPSRIFSCNGKIENNENAAPRTTLSL